MPLPRSFYDRSTLNVARELLGARLVRLEDGVRISGVISETEAYIGEEDQGCHARSGLTARTTVMFGPPGHAYIYFTYGIHWMLNAVTEKEGYPAAVLIRAIQPMEGFDVIAKRRGKQPIPRWTDGPAKVTQALGIEKILNGVDLCETTGGLWIEPGISIPDTSVTISPRVGLYTVPEPWKSKPWRFLIASAE